MGFRGPARAPEHFVVELRDAELVVRLLAQDPGARLALGVDEHGVARGVGHHDAVLDGQLVRGQALQIPLADGGVVDEEGGEVHVGRGGHAERLAIGEEVALDEEVAELLVEGAEVGHEGGADAAVAREALDGLVKLLALRRPARLLARQRADERVGAVHLLLRRRRVLLQRLLLRHGLVELGLRLVELGLHHRHALLRSALLPAQWLHV